MGDLHFLTNMFKRIYVQEIADFLEISKGAFQRGI